MILMLSEIKPKFTPLINAVAKPFSKVHPNILSIIGMIFPILFFVLMANKQYGWALLSMLGTLFDLLDGAVARMSNRITKFGALLDSTLDRIADGLMIVAFFYAGLVNIELVLIVLVESYLISYIRSRAELAAKGEFVLNVGIIERPERLLILAFALFSALPITTTILGCTLTTTIYIALAILSAVTVLQRLYLAAIKLK